MKMTMKMTSKYILPLFFILMIFSVIFYTHLRKDVTSTKTAIKESLFDPESAMFSNITSRDDFVCGELNAKNRWGGYTGKKRFISFAKEKQPIVTIENEEYLKDFNEYWDVFCAES